MELAYEVRLYCVYSTYWRRSKKTVRRVSGDFDLTDRFKSFYLSFEGQLPELLSQRIFDTAEVAITPKRSGPGEFDGVRSAELVLFSLPFPANQIVAALVLDFATTDLNEDSTHLRGILEACTESAIRIGGRSITQIVDELAVDARAEKEIPSDPHELPRDVPQERHALVFIENLQEREAPADAAVAGILHGIQPPYRPEFTQLERPESLNQEAGKYAAVSPTSSFFYGHPSVVENSVFLTTVQAVGTAARFQRIWRDAYYQVQEFQSSGRQAKRAGEQRRKDLELLADEMGNLELDLAFSVETAADLGLGSTTSRIDHFHDDLYQVMHIKTRASTVSQMFVRLSSSIRSELTAIESREKELEDSRRLRGALALGVLSFFLAPLGLILAFFGINATQVDQKDTMFDLHRYWPIYVLAGLLMVISVVFAVTFDHAALSQALADLRRRLGLQRRDATPGVSRGGMAPTPSREGAVSGAPEAPRLDRPPVPRATPTAPVAGPVGTDHAPL
jgi:hypothetical protein